MELYQISLNNLRRRKMKMMFVLIGIIIGISTIVSVYSIVETMKLEMTRQASGYGVNVTITPDAGSLSFSYGGITLPEIMYDVEQLTNEDLTILQELSTKDMIKVVAPKLYGMKKHSHHNLIIVGANLPQEFTVRPWIRLSDGTEESQDTNPSTNPVETDGKDMDFELIDLSRQDIERLTNIKDNELILGASIAMTLELNEGDQITIDGKIFEINGVLLESGATEDQHVFMNLSAAQELLNKPGEITVIDMAVDYTAGSEETLLQEIEEKLPHTNVSSLRQETLRRDDMLSRLVRFGVTVSIIVLLVGMLVVGLTMTGSVRERTREIGVFRAIGFRKSHIFKLILLEGAVISFLGGVIGFFAGTVLAKVVGPYFAAMEIQIPFRFELLIYSIVLATIIGMVSSIYPAYKAAQQDPVEALRFI